MGIFFYYNTPQIVLIIALIRISEEATPMLRAHVMFIIEFFKRHSEANSRAPTYSRAHAPSPIGIEAQRRCRLGCNSEKDSRYLHVYVGFHLFKFQCI